MTKIARAPRPITFDDVVHGGTFAVDGISYRRVSNHYGRALAGGDTKHFVSSAVVDSADRAVGGEPRLALLELRQATEPCRDDMHEPDEQNLTARVVGDRLDNAMGAYIDANSLAQGFQEYVVCFQRFDEALGDFVTVRVNLATVVALARKAVL